MQNDIVLDKYQLEKKLNETPIVTHYRGADIESGQIVLVTVINQETVPSEEFLSRFELVAETLKDVNSPCGAILLDYGEHEEQAVMVQEHIEGQTLSEMLVDSDGLPVNMVLDIARQVGEYLKALHQFELVHGSLGLETILLSSKGTLRIIDAGLAYGLGLSELLSSGKLEAQPYHAPGLRAGGELTPAVDFYALGATLYALLTGEKLDLEPSDLWPGNKKHGLPPELDELVFKCLQADPARRIQSAAELLNGVEEVHRGTRAGAQDTILGMEDALVGHTLGAYQLTERLGQGGMATVYKAYEPALDRYVAIKVLPQFFARDPNFIQRFRREAKAIAQLDHPNIVPIYSFGEEGDITYIAMRHVKGGTLKQQRGQVYGPEEAVRLLLHVARALEYAHQEGVVHRDVKPSNVLMSKRNWPLLTDFGLAKMAEASTQLTGTGVGVGTPMYMSPEQGQGSKDVDQRTDIYSLGIMLYEMLTGDVPFRADTPMGVVIKHITAPMPMPREVNPDIPEILERIILKATAKDPVDRYQTAEEMVISLERALNEMEAAPKVAQEISVAAPEVIPPRTKPVVQKPLKKKSKVGIILKIGFMGIGIIFCLMIVGGVIYGGIQGVQDAFATPTPSVVSALMPATETQSPDTKPTSTTAITETRAPTSIPFSSFEWPLVFSDTFDENVNNWPTGVDDDEFARCDWSITDGKYRWDAEAHQGFNWHVWPDAREASDLNLTVDARQISGPEDALYGVVFRMSDSDNFYLFGLSNYQSFTFRRKYEGEWEILIDWTENTNIRPGKANQITIVAMGSHFTFLINDQLVAEADDDVMFFGKAGLSIELYGEGDAAVFEFDNFELRAPEGVGFMEFITCLEDAA